MLILIGCPPWWRRLLFCLLVFLVSQIPKQVKGQLNAGDLAALIQIRDVNDSSGSLVSDWVTGLENTWPGVTWISVGGEWRVNKLILDNKGMSGNLDISGLPHLTHLYCNHNSLKAISGLASTSSLTNLDCSDNQLDSLPGIENHTNLVELKCSENQLLHLNGVESLSGLNHLDCTKNKLEVNDLISISNLSIGTFAYSPQYPPGRSNIPLLALENSPLTIQVTSPGPGTQFTWARNDTFITPLIPTSPEFAVVNMGDQISCQMTHSLLSLLSPDRQHYDITTSEPITCDINRDSVRNMFDLVELGLTYGQTGSQRAVIHLPSDTTYVPHFDWVDNLGTPMTVLHDGDEINFKHVDTNGDGVINEVDFGCIEEYYTPLKDSRKLSNLIGSTEVGLRAVPQDHLITMDDSGHFEVPFSIEIDALPMGVDSINLRGLVFIRGVVEDTSLMEVTSIQGDLTNSDFAYDTQNVLAKAIFHPDIAMDTNSSAGLCLNLPVKQLDVGVVRKDVSRKMALGMGGLVCQVLGDAKLSSSGVSAEPFIPVVGDINTVTFYVDDGSGGVTAVTASCTTDTTVLFVDSLIGKTPVTGNIHTLNGLPVEATLHAEMTSGDVDFLNDSLGDFTVIGEFNDYLKITVSKGVKCPEQEAITREDLIIFQDYLDGLITLNPWQMVAADIDNNQIVNATDFDLLGDFQSGVLSSFPDGNWLFLNSDMPPTSPNPFEYEDFREYSSLFREAGQDFIAVLKGDLDFSWDGTCNSKEPVRPVKGKRAFSQQLEWRVYPNPSAGGVTIDCGAGNSVSSIEILSLEGKLIRQHRVAPSDNPRSWTWDRTNDHGHPVRSGLFFVRFTADQQINVKKLLLLPTNP